jgi:hypothetical protein
MPAVQITQTKPVILPIKLSVLPGDQRVAVQTDGAINASAYPRR